MATDFTYANYAAIQIHLTDRCTCPKWTSI